MANSSSAWPVLGSTKDAVRPEDIRWETVKTEEEEYLDKLQSKLSRVMMGEVQKSHRETVDRVDNLDPDELADAAQVTMPHDDDEGLHLMYDCPRPDFATDDEPAPKSFAQPFASSSSSQPLKVEITPDAEDYDIDVDVSPSSRRRTVRFRSRVRITSGVHAVPDSSSSTCGSVSSSISVPLRGPREPSITTSAAPLSEMLPSETASAWLSGLSATRKAGRERRRSSTSPRSPHVDERTPLASANHSGRRRSYTEQPPAELEEDADADDELDRIRAAARKTEEQVMFGKWPWRFFNRHWWWWKLEFIICCCSRFDDESDVE